MNLGPGKEFDRIRAIFNRISELSPEAESLGDDCALVPLGTTTLAVSIDASLEGVHFRTDWLDFKEIGFRAAGAALRTSPPMARRPLASSSPLACRRGMARTARIRRSRSWPASRSWRTMSARTFSVAI